VVLAPEHPLVQELTSSDRRNAVAKFIAEVAAQSEIDRTAEDKPKRGMAIGAIALNPFTRQGNPDLDR
jgi:leucyl-tRNA synthetase